jgi:UDP-N-acetylmuramoyl-tripeptide--D-alanyl-D-alanine ligase
MATEFGRNAYAFDNKPDLIAALKNYLEVGDTVLVKGSRSAEMEVVVDALATDLVQRGN